MNVSVLFIPSTSNPQCYLLKNALTKSGCIVVTDINQFWNPTRYYDILHIQFPEFLDGFTYSRVKSIQYKSDVNTIKQLNHFKNTGTKIIWTAFNLKGHEQKHIGKKNLIYNEMSRICHGIITIGQSSHKALLDTYPAIKNKPITVIPHGNYIDVYPNRIHKNEAREKLNIQESNVVLLYFGLQRKYKDIYLVYKSFKDANKKTKNLQLLIAGQPWGIKRRLFFLYLKYFNKNIIVVSTYIKDHELQIYFNAADIAIFAFADILTSGSIILAQSFGLPTIAPNIGCIPDMVPKSVGFLYKHRNKAHLSETILSALNYDLATMGLKAKIIQFEIEWKSIGQKTKNFYESIINT